MKPLPKEVELTTPLSRDDVQSLEIGDIIYLNGVVFTSRDLAHQRIVEHLERGEELAEDLKGGAIFHAGPVVERRNGGWEVVAIGPTSSIRMEPFSEIILGRLGVKAIIGKGGWGMEPSPPLRGIMGSISSPHPAAPLLRERPSGRFSGCTGWT